MVRPVDPLTRLLHRPLPAPHAAWRRGPFRPGSFTSAVRGPWLTSRLGLALGIAFAVCFATGLLSHLIQHPPSWFGWPSRPVGLYRVTQGLHVATGLASVALLTAKLWSVFPKLFAWPPFRDVGHLLERLSIVVLASAALFEVVTGLLNITYWYAAMPFGFIAAHYWVGWLAIGALLLHVAVKAPIIRQGLRRASNQTTPSHGGLSRRGFLATVAAAVGVITVSTLGQTVRPLSRVSVLAPHRPDIGPQGVPVNTSAVAAGVAYRLADPGYRLMVEGPGGRLELSRADLADMPQTTVRLPITCVEGWSADGEWTGVRVRDLVALVGGGDHSTVVVESIQPEGPYRTSELEPTHAADPLTVIALRLHGEDLHVDHGYPARLIAPNRPGVMQTKWVNGIRVQGS